MSEEAFRKLLSATRIVDTNTLYFSWTAEWESKRNTLIVQLSDLPRLLEAHRGRRNSPYGANPSITFADPVPTLRLANACEASANCLYSMAEIAANFANRLSKGELPSRFNALRKKCEANPSLKAALALGDLQWYRKVRELRTEWTHYSSIFIGEDDAGRTLLCVREYRRSPADKAEFKSRFSCTVGDLIDWIERALATLDGFAGYLLEEFVIPSLRPRLGETLRVPVYDENGVPIVRNCLMANEEISVRECLRRSGIEVEG